MERLRLGLGGREKDESGGRSGWVDNLQMRHGTNGDARGDNVRAKIHVNGELHPVEAERN